MVVRGGCEREGTGRGSRHEKGDSWNGREWLLKGIRLVFCCGEKAGNVSRRGSRVLMSRGRRGGLVTLHYLVVQIVLGWSWWQKLVIRMILSC